jgi:hypothetical protein
MIFLIIRSILQMLQHFCDLLKLDILIVNLQSHSLVSFIDSRHPTVPAHSFSKSFNVVH